MEVNQVKNVMGKGNKTSPKEKDKSLCDSCEHYFDSSCVTRNKNGYNYCKSCNYMQISALKYCESINKEDFDKMLKMAIDTPPLESDWWEKNQKGKRKKDSK